MVVAKTANLVESCLQLSLRNNERFVLDTAIRNPQSQMAGADTWSENPAIPDKEVTPYLT